MFKKGYISDTEMTLHTSYATNQIKIDIILPVAHEARLPLGLNIDLNLSISAVVDHSKETILIIETLQ